MADQDTYIEVELEAAKYWAKNCEGSVRGIIWSRAVSRFEKLTARGGRPQIRWWSSKMRRDPDYGGGLIEVIDRPRLRRRRRRRPAP